MSGSNETMVPAAIAATIATTGDAGELLAWIRSRPRDDWGLVLDEIGSRDPGLAAALRAQLRADESLARSWKKGERHGAYTLIEPLGVGGSATVWRARDEGLQRLVALKLFDLVALGDGGTLALSEARAACRIASDFVIRVYDAGRLDADTAFIAMDLCEVPTADGGSELGRSLADAPPADATDAVRVIAQAARGVHAGHQVGVFHRDVKPANILRRPGDRRAQVIDFGIAARATRARPAQADADSARRIIAGTPAFMAPEQADGLSPDVDTGREPGRLVLIDVYGLAATLWALLAGRDPFLMDPEAGDPLRELIDRVAATPPAPLAEVCRDAGRAVPHSRLLRILERAMAHDPQERHPDALALAADLDAFLGDFPASTDEGRPLLRARLWARRNPSSLSAGLAVMVASVAVVTTLGLAWRIDDQRQQLAASDARADTMLAERQRADASLAETRTVLTAAREDMAAVEKLRASIEQNLGEREKTLLRTQRTLRETDARLASETLALQASEAEAASQKARADAGEALAAEQRARAEVGEARAAAEASRATRAETLARTSAEEANEARARAVQAESRAERAEARLAAAETRLASAEAATAAAERKADAANQRATAAEAALAALNPTPSP